MKKSIFLFIILCFSFFCFAQKNIENSKVYVKGFGTKFELNRIKSKKYPILLSLKESIKRPSVWMKVREGEIDHNNKYSDTLFSYFEESLINNGYQVEREINREKTVHNTFFLFQYDIREITQDNNIRVWIKITSCTYNSSVDYEIGSSSYDTVFYINRDFFIKNIEATMYGILMNICTEKDQWEIWTYEDPTSTSMSKSVI
jgi:hypothetical protein